MNFVIFCAFVIALAHVGLIAVVLLDPERRLRASGGGRKPVLPAPPPSIGRRSKIQFNEEYLCKLVAMDDFAFRMVGEGKRPWNSYRH